MDKKDRKPRAPDQPDGNPPGTDEDGVLHLDVTDEPAENPEQSESALQLAKLKNDFLYLGAEFDNYKKHAIKERSELVRYGSERFARDLLEIVDNFERALSIELTPDTLTNFRDGISIIHRELRGLLTRHGVIEIDPVGQPFDPAMHEALTSEATDQVAPGSIARVFKKAYRLHDRLLRPAQVVVAKAPSGEQE